MLRNEMHIKRILLIKTMITNYFFFKKIFIEPKVVNNHHIIHHGIDHLSYENNELLKSCYG